MDKETNELGFVHTILDIFETDSLQKIYQKAEFLIREGEVEQYLYFIETGAVKVFYLTEFDEHIVRLGYDGSMLNSLSSFLKNEPSELYIEAIKKTTVKRIKKETIRRYVEQNEHSLRQYNRFLEMVLSQQIDREIDLLVTSPSERLKRVLKRSPKLFQYIPLKYIASYLRMKPETLSRIRNS